MTASAGKRAFRLLGLGDNTVDTYVDLGQQFPGGNAVNVAVLAGRMGANAAYLGCMGNDAAGDMLRAALASEGIDLDRCRRIAGANARAFIAHNAGDRRFIRSEPGVRGAWGTFEAADMAWIAGFDLVHSSIFSELEPTLALLRPHIRQFAFDFSERWNDAVLGRLLPQIDIAFLSNPRGSDDDCVALLRQCAALGPADVVVTRGARGAIALRSGEVAACLPVPTEVVDTLGAGDAFIAAYLVARHGGAGLAASLSSAAGAAAHACRSLGAFGHGAPWCAPEGAAASAT